MGSSASNRNCDSGLESDKKVPFRKQGLHKEYQFTVADALFSFPKLSSHSKAQCLLSSCELSPSLRVGLLNSPHQERWIS